MKKINGNIAFCAFAALMAILIILGALQGNAEEEVHRGNHARYRGADNLVIDGQPEVAIRTYVDLMPKYPSSYILVYKVAVCEYYLGNYDSAISYWLRLLEMHPRIVEDKEFLKIIEECYTETGDDASAKAIRERL